MIKNITIALSFVLAVTAIVLCLCKGQKRSVYVNTGILYSEFELSKELNKDLEKVFNSRKFLLDSLFEDLKQQSTVIQENGGKDKGMTERFAVGDREYMYKKEMFEKQNQEMMTEYNAKIWNQINQYLQDYGEDKSYSFIFGATGQGNIMFGDKEEDITKEVVKYINARYNDKPEK